MSQEKNYHGKYDADVSELAGKTITKVEGINPRLDTVTIECSDGSIYQMHHYDDCCESVYVEDVVGDVNDLIGSPILVAEEVSSSDPSDEVIAERKAAYEAKKHEHDTGRYKDEPFYHYGPSPENNWKDESETWTFYKFSTIKGSVTIRWYGSSNGYYSESVDFERVTA